MNILLIDDEKGCCDALEIFFAGLGTHTVVSKYDSMQGLEYIKNNSVDLVLTDVDMPRMDGVELTGVIKQDYPEIEVILVSGKEDIIDSINAIEYGALDFLTKPVDIRLLREIISGIEKRKNSGEKFQPFPIVELQAMKDSEVILLNDFDLSKYTIKCSSGSRIGIFSDRMHKLRIKLRKLAEYPGIPVLIEGETGSGKEMIVNILAEDSPDRPLVPINCPTLPRDIFEAEVFGYEKGAFTGADPAGKKGFVQAAGNGTLFFDEITEVPIEIQSKLLRLVQEGEYYRIGSKKLESTKARFIFASNRKLEKAVKEGHFRGDLFYRINMCRITLSPVRERLNEVLPMCLLFIEEFNFRHGKAVRGIEAGAVRKLQSYSWPGNVRELRNIIYNALLFSDRDCLTSADIVIPKSEVLENTESSGTKTGGDIRTFELPEGSFDLDTHIKDLINAAIRKFNGNKSQAARYLGISRMQLYHKLSE